MKNYGTVCVCVWVRLLDNFWSRDTRRDLYIKEILIHFRGNQIESLPCKETTPITISSQNEIVSFLFDIAIQSK